MARRKKPKPFRAVKAVKEMARERIGAPRPELVAPDRKKAKYSAKNKLTLTQLLQSDSE